MRSSDKDRDQLKKDMLQIDNPFEFCCKIYFFDNCTSFTLLYVS